MNRLVIFLLALSGLSLSEIALAAGDLSQDTYLRHLESGGISLGEVFYDQGQVQTVLAWSNDLPLCYINGKKIEACNNLNKILSSVRTYATYCRVNQGSDTLSTFVGIGYNSTEFEYHKDIGPCPEGTL